MSMIVRYNHPFYSVEGGCVVKKDLPVYGLQCIASRQMNNGSLQLRAYRIAGIARWAETVSYPTPFSLTLDLPLQWSLGTDAGFIFDCCYDRCPRFEFCLPQNTDPVLVVPFDWVEFLYASSAEELDNVLCWGVRREIKKKHPAKRGILEATLLK